jgi:hypothetical protein
MIQQPDGDCTPWSLTSLLFFGGIVAAAQVGKAIVSLPLIRTEMSLGIDSAAVILSVFATLGATCGICGGALVSWYGARRALLLGMVGLAVGNVCGAFATDPCGSCGGATHRRLRLLWSRAGDAEPAIPTDRYPRPRLSDGAVERLHADRDHGHAAAWPSVADDRLAVSLARQCGGRWAHHSLDQTRAA